MGEKEGSGADVSAPPVVDVWDDVEGGAGGGVREGCAGVVGENEAIRETDGLAEGEGARALA